MPAGPLKHYVTVQVKTETRSNSGAVVESWATAYETWAAYEPLGSRMTGGEFRVAEKRHAETTARFRMRYRSTPKLDVEKHRIVLTFDGESSPPEISTFNILHIEHVDGARFWTLVEVSEIK